MQDNHTSTQEPNIVLTTNEARAGRETSHMRHILFGSMAFAIVLILLVLLLFAG